MEKALILVLLIILVLAAVIEIGLPVYVAAPLKAGDFYASLPRERAAQRQREVGLQAASGPGWGHLAWVADPEQEQYLIEKQQGAEWVEAARVAYGSYLIREVGPQRWRVSALQQDGTRAVLGEVSLEVPASTSPALVPHISGPWQTLFVPDTYANDHTVFFNDVLGQWQVISITSESQQGDYNLEKHFAVGYSEGSEFPPAQPIRQSETIVDTGQLAWAPHAIKAGDTFHLFWSPHQLYQMESPDGQHWSAEHMTMAQPVHKFFRDPMVLEVAPGQWLLYTTAKGENGKSRVDVYQSFNLQEWQYIGPALDSGSGSERNSPFASMESPFVFQHADRYYLSITYNNDTPAFYGLLLSLKIWPNPQSYNDTLIFTATNPYDFGMYRGRSGDSPSYLTQLAAHAPEYIQTADGRWFLTTAGWPWVASLTKGEIAVAPMEFQ